VRVWQSSRWNCIRRKPGSLSSDDSQWRIGRKKNQGKPATFNFLGFTHRCAKRWKDGRFTVIRSTIAKRMGAKLQQTGNALMERRSQPLAEQGKWLASVVRGW